MQKSKRTIKTTRRVGWRSLLKKDLTGPILLEITGKATNQEFALRFCTWKLAQFGWEAA